MKSMIEKEIQGIVGTILEDYTKDRVIDKTADIYNQLDQSMIIEIIQKLLKIIYPGYYKERSYKTYNVSSELTILIEDTLYHLNQQIALALGGQEEYRNLPKEEVDAKAEELSVEFFKQIPKVRALIDTDIQATYDGDPAAKTMDEIIFCYPGLLAITINRIAHELYLLQVPMIPRIMTEYAHSRTGIDIHPGATIGKYFFIDHGTGIVVGETTVIGDNVKIYQGVTLGALSTRGGQKLRDKRRHPTIEDNVTIYSGASILGGDTIIGKGVVIGGNAFITSSIKAGTKVSVKSQDLEFFE